MTEDTRNDGAIINALTGLGTLLDKTESIQPGWGTKLNPQRQEELFLQPIIQNICSAYASEGTRAGWEITLGGDKQDPKLIQAFDNYRNTLGSDDEDDELLSDVELVKTAQIWANIYGGAALVLNIDDGQPPNEPVDLTKINTIRSVEILDKNRISPDLTQTTNPLRPTHYRILIAARPGDRLNLDNEGGRAKKTAKGDYYTYPIHRSRVISFYGRDGRVLPPDLMSRYGYWGQSSIDAIWDDFKIYENVYRSIASMVDDASLFVYYSKGLKKTVENGKESVLRTRFASLRFGAKNLGGAAIDLEEEKIEWLSRQFTGLPELGDRFRDRLVAVSGLPATVILGRGPLGLAAQGTGDAEEQVWERMVNAWQETVLRCKLRRMLRYIWLAKDGPTKGKEPPDWDFTYKPLRVQTEQEKLDVRASAANTYLSYVRDGVLTADEVRDSQFGGSEYSIEIKLDQKAWEEKKKAEEEQANAFGGDFGGYDPNALPPEAAAPAEEAPLQEEVVQDSYYADAKKPARRQGDRIWVEDKRVKNGGYWRKSKLSLKEKSPGSIREGFNAQKAAIATGLSVGGLVAATGLTYGALKIRHNIGMGEGAKMAQERSKVETVEKIDPNKATVFAVDGLHDSESAGYVAKELGRTLGADYNIVSPPLKFNMNNEEDERLNELSPIGSAVKRYVSSLLENGYNPDAVNLTSKIIAHKKQYPDNPVNLVGHSAGSVITNQAQEMLRNSGIEVNVVNLAGYHTTLENLSTSNNATVINRKDSSVPTFLAFNAKLTDTAGMKEREFFDRESGQTVKGYAADGWSHFPIDGRDSDGSKIFRNLLVQKRANNDSADFYHTGRNDACGCPLEDDRLRSGVSVLDPYQQDQMTLLRSRPVSESGKETIIQSIAQSYPEEVSDVEFYQINPDGSISGEFSSLNNGIYNFKYQKGYLGYGWNRDSRLDNRKPSRLDNRKPRKKKLDSEEEKEPSDYLVEEAIATSAKPLNALLKPIKSWMRQFNSLEEIRDNLPQLYDRLEGDTFGEHLEQWMLLAHLAGQSEVVEESYGSDRTETSG